MSLRLWIVDLFCFLHHVDGLFTCFHIFFRQCRCADSNFGAVDKHSDLRSLQKAVISKTKPCQSCTRTSNIDVVAVCEQVWKKCRGRFAVCFIVLAQSLGRTHWSFGIFCRSCSTVPYKYVSGGWLCTWSRLCVYVCD